MPIRSLLLIIVIALSFAQTGCDLIQGKGDAEEVVAEILEKRLSDGGFAAEDELYSSFFWDNTSDKDWQRVKTLVEQALGDLKSYELNTWNMKTNFHTNELSGTFVVLLYDTVYEKGTGTEKFTMHKGVGKDSYLILGHRVESPLFEEIMMEGLDRLAEESSE